MQNKLQKALRLICILLGVIILLYPSLSTYLSEKNGSRVNQTYDESTQQMAAEEEQALLQAAMDYNRALAEQNLDLPPTDAAGRPVCPDEYWALLDPMGNGMIGYIELPTLGETIPIYHGTSEEVLQIAIGHVVNTSLPVGGPSTHAALSGHRGLPSASLFTNLDQMQEGDRFYVHVLNHTMAYQVDQILVVEPTETKDIAVVPGEDYVTLITCTPYGVNSHRLLVRGTRVPYEPGEAPAAAAPSEETTLAKIPMQYRHLALGLLVILLVLVLRWIWLAVRKLLRKRGH